MAAVLDEELAREFLEYARYGEVDDLRALIQSGDVPVDFADPGGSTALHKAAANGVSEDPDPPNARCALLTAMNSC